MVETAHPLGEADPAAEIGVTPGEDERELLHVRSMGCPCLLGRRHRAPAAAVTTDFRDVDRLRRTALALKRLGFRGRACIHPFPGRAGGSPGPGVRFEAAGGVCLDPQGRMAGLAVVRDARRMLGDGGIS